MFTKQDERFDQMTFDPTLRRAKIADLSMRRTIIFWCAIVMVGAIAEMWNGHGATGGVFAAAVIWGICFKMDSDLRLLRVVERLQKREDDKTPS
jgi:hypothetical protein